MIEVWKPVRGWESLYEVSSQGRVKSLRSGKILRPGIHPSGHRKVSLRKASIHQQAYVHRLVADAYLPNPLGYPFVLHWDDDPGNNSVENLRWGNNSENQKDSVRNGSHPNSKKTHCPAGHPYSETNTRVNSGSRFCKICNTLKVREYRQRRKEQS